MSAAILKAVVAAALVTLLVLAYNAFVDHQRDIGYQSAVAEYRKQENIDLKAALAETIRLNGKVQEAENAAIEREKERQRLDARVVALSGQLRNTERSIERLVSSASEQAVRQATLALNELLADCRGSYEDMGRAAQGHSDDVRTLIDAWPVIEATH